MPRPVAAAEPPAFTLWFRRSTRARWVPVAAGATFGEAHARIGAGGRRHGDWLTLPTGTDANARRPGV